jgi:thiosulfate/3-mercaptopyruvate sulfurtransferase
VTVTATDADRRASLLVDSAALAVLQPAPVLIDCRFDLAKPAAGYAAFRQGHIPGARHAHLDEDLAGPTGPDTGRHPLPDAARFTAACARLGIGARTPVVAYDDGSGAFAARLWWLLRYFGHTSVRLLDGGLAAWRRGGYPLVTGDAAPAAPVDPPFLASAGHAPTVAAATLLGPGAPRLIDVRAADRFAGRVEPIDPVAGHVPGASNLPFAAALGEDSRFRPVAELRALYAAALGGVTPDRAAVMCGSGVTACHGLFALELAGLPGAALYPGSWSEWIRDPQRPVAKDPPP